MKGAWRVSFSSRAIKLEDEDVDTSINASTYCCEGLTSMTTRDKSMEIKLTKRVSEYRRV